MTRLVVLLTISILSFSAHALSDMLNDMQKTYSTFTSQSNAIYEARGLIQPVWYRFSNNAVETLPHSTERLRLQINGTAVPGDKITDSNKEKSQKITNSIIALIDGSIYCEDLALDGCPVYIRIGEEKPFVARAEMPEGDYRGKVYLFDEKTTQRIAEQMYNTRKYESGRKKAYIEIPLFVVGNKTFEFDMLDVPMR
ncbi:hypothetical protein FQO80_19010 [Salmonella enterica]|nr:hypothetical protein [Salmonella enterica]